MADSPRYDFDTIELDSANVQAGVVKFVAPCSRVSELASPTRYMSHAFAGRGCEVVGIEFDPGMAARSATLYEFKESGRFVISIPNVAHGGVRLVLFSGRFEYGDWGLGETGLDLVELRPRELPFAAGTVSFDEAVLPAGIVGGLGADPAARAHRFLALAVPKGSGKSTGGDDDVRAAAEGGTWTLRKAMDERSDDEALRVENLRRRVRLERILARPPAKLYAALQRLPGMDVLRRRRQAGFEVELRRRGKRS